jgi:hypothetical protein
MLIDNNGDQKHDTEKTQLTDSLSNRRLIKNLAYKIENNARVYKDFDWITSNCAANYTYNSRRNNNDGYYVTFTTNTVLVVFEFNNLGLYVRTLHNDQFNRADGCSAVTNSYLYYDSPESTLGFSFAGTFSKPLSDFENIPPRYSNKKFFDIIKLSNGKTVAVRQYAGKLIVTNIDLFDNFDNRVVHEESISIGDKFGFARIFEFEDGYFVIWRENVKLMIMKFNFDGLMIGEKEKISSISGLETYSIGSVIKDGNKFSVVGWSSTNTYPVSNLDIHYTFQSTNKEYVIEYINPKSKAEYDMYAYIANNVYIGSVLHGIDYERSIHDGCWYNYHNRGSYIYRCYKVVYKRKSLVDLNGIVSIQTPGTLPPTPIPTESPSRYPTFLPTISNSPTFLPTESGTLIPSYNNLDETNPTDPDENTGPPDSTDDADSTDDKNPKDAEDSPDPNDNSATLTVGCVFGSVILLLLCYIKIYNIGFTCESETSKSRRIAFGDNNIREEARV